MKIKKKTSQTRQTREPTQSKLLKASLSKKQKSSLGGDPPLWVREVELEDLTGCPRLFLAVHHLSPKTEPASLWPFEWITFRHQTAGVACHHVRLTGFFLTPRTKALHGMIALHDLWVGSNAGVFGQNLTSVNNYAAHLQDLLGVSCEHSFSDFEEGVYPIDIWDGCDVSRLATDDLPGKLDDLLDFENELSQIAGSIGRWRLFVLGENSD